MSGPSTVICLHYKSYRAEPRRSGPSPPPLGGPGPHDIWVGRARSVAFTFHQTGLGTVSSPVKVCSVNGAIDRAYATRYPVILYMAMPMLKWQRGWANWEPYTDFRTQLTLTYLVLWLVYILYIHVCVEHLNKLNQSINPDANSNVTFVTLVHKLQFNNIPCPNPKFNP